MDEVGMNSWDRAKIELKALKRSRPDRSALISVSAITGSPDGVDSDKHRGDLHVCNNNLIY